MRVEKLLAKIDDLSPEALWTVRQHLAGPHGRYYGDGGTIHHSGYLDVEVADGAVVSVWFRCQRLPFRQHDVDARRADQMNSVAPGVGLAGVQLQTRP